MVNMQLSNENISGQRNPGDLKLTEEELKILKECNSESIKKRGFPCGLAFGASAYYVMKAGYIKGHAKYGAVPGTIAAGIFGYFLGRLSYTSVCIERLMQVPNGTVRRKMESKQGLLSAESSGNDSLYMPVNTEGNTSSRSPAMNSSLDIDIYHSPSNFDGFVGNSENSDLPINKDVDIIENISSQSGLSYEERRKKNREEYMRNVNQRYNRTPTSNTQNFSVEERNANQEKTKYGDIWG